MIPKFPDFKNIELSDKKEVESFTSRFTSYSDFNFTSIWLWDIKGEMMISQLNNNLVVLFRDYISGKPCLSFIGDTQVSETAKTLLNFSKDKYQVNFLKFVPEEVALALPKSDFDITPDKDSYDYIYHIPDLAHMNILRDNSSGKGIKQFIKEHPNYKLCEYLIQDAPQKECEELFNKWAINKKIEKIFEINEYKAFQKLFQLRDDKIRIICLYMNGVMVGFTVYEMLPNNFVMSHFAKADVTQHKSIYDILNWEEAKNLCEKEMKHFNWEQDLGIPGIRQSKEKYMPCFYLEKFIVKFHGEV